MKADWCSVIMDGSNFLRRFCKNFGIDFVKDITKANWMKLVCIFRRDYFWNKSKKSMVKSGWNDT